MPPRTRIRRSFPCRQLLLLVAVIVALAAAKQTHERQNQHDEPQRAPHAEHGAGDEEHTALGGNVKTRTDSDRSDRHGAAAANKHRAYSRRTGTENEAGGAEIDAHAKEQEETGQNNNNEATTVEEAVRHGPPPHQADGEQQNAKDATAQAMDKPEKKTQQQYHTTTRKAHAQQPQQPKPKTQWDQQRAETHTDLSHLNLGSLSASDASRAVMDQLLKSTRDRLTDLYTARAHSDECRRKIGEHMGYFLNAIGVEGSMPFHQEQFYSECDEEKYDFDYLPDGVTIGDIQNRTYQPPRGDGTNDTAVYLDDANDLQLLYAILTHNDPKSTIRLIDVLYEEGYTFVVHVDGKESSDETYDALVEYAATREYVHVLPHPYRVRANWGGFSLVNATLQIMRYSFAHDGYPLDEPLEFHKFVHLASTTYPIASNAEIRRRLASYPLDANFVHVVFKPSDPGPAAWNYFVECDDALHRIYRLTPLDDLNWGIDIYTSSQWFVLSREFAQYIADDAPGTLVHDLREYAEHVVVADESFFGTALRHSKFCGKHHNNNFLHVQFDRWENELDDGSRDPRKCVMKDPDHCGRSPTTTTMDYLPVLELAGDLFARKFNDAVDSNIKDVIDIKRARDEKFILENAVDSFDVPLPPNPVDTSFEGEGVLIVAKETLNDAEPLCLGLGMTKNRVRLFPCFREGVAATLAPTWETGAVIIEETVPHNRWEIGPCSSDGNFERLESGEQNFTRGLHSRTGPSCLLKQVDGLRKGRCTDIESERLKPGGPIHVFPCVHRWNQFVSFGDGEVTPKGSIHANVPLHIIDRIKSKGRSQDPYMCFAVSGRGEPDFDDWEEDAKIERHTMDDEETLVPDQEDIDAAEKIDDKLPLKLWAGKQLISTPCSNADAVIEWIYVPYIIEEDSEDAIDGEAEEEEEEL